MNILVADSDDQIRLEVRVLLQQNGYGAVTAADGQEALILAAQHSIDFLITEWNLPFLHGEKLVRQVYQKCPIPVVIMARPESIIHERIIALPIQGYLAKPLHPEALLITIALAKKHFAESQSLHQQSQSLLEAIDNRKWIDKAKSALTRQGLTEEEAYLKLQRAARDTRRTMTDVAKEVISRRSA